MKIKIELVSGDTLLVNFRKVKTNEEVRWEELTDQEKDEVLLVTRHFNEFYSKIRDDVKDMPIVNLRSQYGNYDPERYANDVANILTTRDKAIDLIYELVEYNPTLICDGLSNFEDEVKFCEENCNNLNESCIIRLLKYYRRKDKQ